jgi:hypothetical protein
MHTSIKRSDAVSMSIIMGTNLLLWAAFYFYAFLPALHWLR